MLSPSKNQSDCIPAKSLRDASPGHEWKEALCIFRQSTNTALSLHLYSLVKQHGFVVASSLRRRSSTLTKLLASTDLFCAKCGDLPY